MQSIASRTDLKGKRVLVRASLNVPAKKGEVQSTFRLLRALPTIQFLTEQGARVVLVGHIGRDPEDTLKPVCEALVSHVQGLVWTDTRIGDSAIEAEVAALDDGDVLMLDNLRGYKGEKANDTVFAQQLASLAEIYVNDAFPVAHREHASIVGVSALLPSYAGLTFMSEYAALQGAMQPESPSLFILGGAKFETKLPLVEQYAERYDRVLIGGALANDLLKARGFSVGKSVVSDIDLSNASIVHNDRVLLPSDITVWDGETKRVTTPDDVRDDEYIYDAGPQTIQQLREYLATAKTVLWNGPFGYYEEGFDEYTKQCAQEIAASDAHSVVGGGDTVAAIESLGIQDDFGFVSTAGGAMLAFLEQGTLPAIEALQKPAK